MLAMRLSKKSRVFPNTLSTRWCDAAWWVNSSGDEPLQGTGVFQPHTITASQTRDRLGDSLTASVKKSILLPLTFCLFVRVVV